MADAPEYFLKPGYIFFTARPRVVYTVLGSCVAVTLWDGRQRCCVINHFLYPVKTTGVAPTAKYGRVALFASLKMMLEHGSRPADLNAQVFGGGDIGDAGVGRDNVRIARDFLAEHGIRVSSEDVGGSLGRKVVYYSDTNEAVVLKVEKIRRSDWFPYEKE
ncbi:MAG: chemotaxis protein CheD [Deltaproteobacteria bacterium]|nr:chemotaxis protein CheD [Candidatus Anaeroferrophillacea bacterium]